MATHETTVDDAQVVLSRPEAVGISERGAMVAIHRAPMLGSRLVDARRGLELAAARAPRGIVVLTVFRLSPRFPFELNWDSNLHDLADTLRAADRTMTANALLIEFGGIRAMAARLAMRTVAALARPNAQLADFDSLTSAVHWLTPHARRVGAADDRATYQRLYDEADRRLAAYDAAS